MKRRSIYEMVNNQVLGFFREKELKKDNPLEEVEYVTSTFHEDGQHKLELTSKSYTAIVLKEFFEPCKRYFKDAIILLGKPRMGKAIKEEVSLVIFALGQRFYAVLTPTTQTSLISESEEP